VNTLLAQRREHLLDRVSDPDQRTNTNVEISNDIEDKANEKNRFI
jgi:hypothetical protein